MRDWNISLSLAVPLFLSCLFYSPPPSPWSFKLHLDIPFVGRLLQRNANYFNKIQIWSRTETFQRGPQHPSALFQLPGSISKCFWMTTWNSSRAHSTVVFKRMTCLLLLSSSSFYLWQTEQLWYIPTQYRHSLRTLPDIALPATISHYPWSRAGLNNSL